jgi:Chalcone isomerase-like
MAAASAAREPDKNLAKLLFRLVLALFTSAFLGGAVAAAELDGIVMPDTQTVAGTSLVLNGLALRTHSILRIRIYVAGLYLEHRSSDPDAILASNEPKLLRFVFVRDVDAESGRNSWRESLANSCGKPCRLPAEHIDRFLAAIPPVQKGDTITFVFTPEGLDAFKNEGLIGRVPDLDFVHVILASFIGARPTSAALKRGLLGNP